MPMNEFQHRLSQAMQDRHMKAAALAQATGLSKASISQYTNGVYCPSAKAIVSIAAALGVSEAWLMGADVPMHAATSSAPSPESPPPQEHDSLPSPTDLGLSALRLRRYPVLGRIACGQPIFAEEDHEGGYVTAADVPADFCLTAKGDSMVNALIFDGDEVLIQQTDMVNNGEVAAVIVENEATLKRVFYYPAEARLVLKPENPAYQPLTFSGEDLNHIHILGRAVAVQRRVR